MLRRRNGLIRSPPPWCEAPLCGGAAGVYRIGATSSRGAAHALRGAFRSQTLLEAQSDKLPEQVRFGPAHASFVERRRFVRHTSAPLTRPLAISPVARCRQAIRRVVPDADVILYASRARGNAQEYSDYDILVLVDQPASVALKDQILSSVYPLEFETGAMLTLVTCDRRRWGSLPYTEMPFHKNVERDGVLV